MIATANGSWWDHLTASYARKRIIIVGKLSGQLCSLPSLMNYDPNLFDQLSASHTVPKDKIPRKKSPHKSLPKALGTTLTSRRG